MYIQLTNAVIRPFQKGDEESIAYNGNNRKIWRNVRNGFPHPYTLADAEIWVKIATEF